MTKKQHRSASDKNLTRYTRDKTSFQGWRVCISRQGAMFTRYIPDAAYGSGEAAKAAAIQLRDEILAAIQSRPAKEVLEEYRLKFLRPSARKNEQAKAVTDGDAL